MNNGHRSDLILATSTRVVILLQLCFLGVLSCTGDNSLKINEMDFLISDYRRTKLSLVNGKNVTKEKTVLDSTNIYGVIHAGFLSPNAVYVVFEGVQGEYTEVTAHIRTYDLPGFNGEDVFVYRGHDNIRIIDIENTAGYFSGYMGRNRLMHLDFENQTYRAVFEFSKDEKIISLDCRSSDQFVLVNTSENDKIHRYYYIDKYSHEKIYEGYGHIYPNKYSNYIIYVNNSRVYMLDDPFEPTEKIEINVKKNKYFKNAIAVDKNSFILCFYSTIPDLLALTLFGTHVDIERYDYRFIRIHNNNAHDLEYRKVNAGWRNKFGGMILFDVMRK